MKKRYGTYGRNVSRIVKRYGKYGRKVSWIVKRYGKCGRKVSWIGVLSEQWNIYKHIKTL
jgi:hypothetical protein